MKIVKVGKIAIGKDPVLIAGPCVIESRRKCLDLANRLVDLAGQHKIPLIFKASYDKANRTSLTSFRGPGIDQGLDILAEVKERFGCPVLTDVHSEEDAFIAAEDVDIIQIPAFLCRQTDLLLAAGATGIPVNIKKGQFLSPNDMINVIKKVESTGNKKIILTERGTMFGYNNLVVDMRSLMIMKQFGYPVIFDGTHSVQRPGGAGDKSSGERQFVSGLCRAAMAVGCDGLFLEAYINPNNAKSDGANAIAIKNLPEIWEQVKSINRALKGRKKK